MSGFVDVMNAMTTALAPVAPLSVGKRYDEQNVSPPEYLVFPIAESMAGSEALASSNPRSLHTRLVRAEVHCWGTDYGNAEQLRALFVTVMRQVMAGSNYALGNATWVDPKNFNFGASLIQEFTLRIPLVAMAIPLADDKYTTTIIKTAGFDNTGTVVGDGKLDAGEG